jgi:transposase InsO family protein
MYCGGCVFTDHATGYVHIEFQKTLNTHATLHAKEAYELHCRDVGVVPQQYQADNGKAFTSAGFAQDLQRFEQVIRLAGVGAHHHNGIAECTVGTVMSIARAMMIHSAIHWPQAADAALWPMAVQHAVYLWNRVPSPNTGISPSDLFTRT